MKLLLDTHTLIWFAQANENLSQSGKLAITNSENTCFVSVVTFWEMAIKIRLGKLKLKMSLEDMENLVIKNGIKILPVAIEHIFPIMNMPLYHADPFDRLLISQAMCEKMALLSKDSKFSPYSVDYNIKIIW